MTNAEIQALLDAVGSRVAVSKVRAILDDLTAGDVDLNVLWNISGQLAIQHPNCPLEWWWGAARNYPLSAISSPAYLLLTLEDPSRWNTLVENRASEWFGDAIHEGAMSDANWWNLAADCLEYALSQKAGHRSESFGEAIDVRRRIARGELSGRHAVAVLENLVGALVFRMHDAGNDWTWLARAMQQVPWFTTLRMVANRYPLWCWTRFLHYYYQGQSSQQVGALPTESDNPLIQEALAQGQDFTAERIKDILSWSSGGPMPEQQIEFATLLPELPLYGLICIEDPLIPWWVNTFIPGTREADESMRKALSWVFNIDQDYEFSLRDGDLSWLYDIASTILSTADYIQGGWASSELVEMGKDAYDELEELLETAMVGVSPGEIISLPHGGISGVARSMRRKSGGLSQFMPDNYSFASCFVSAGYSMVEGGA